MKTVVITGATKGIGLSISKSFASAGHHLIICSRSENDLQAAKKELGRTTSKVHAFVVDVSKKDDLKKFAEEINQISPTIDVLVNNAGVFLPGSVHDENEDQIRILMDTNLMSAYYLSRALIPGMKSKGSGHIFNICSIASLAAYPPGGSYSISKFALYGFSQALRDELKDFGISVTAVIPGATFSSSWEGTNIDPQRLMNADDIAKMVQTISELSSRSVVEDIVMRPQLGDL